MKISFIKLRIFAVSFSFLLVFQSCKTYYANTVSMEAAVKNGKPANILYSDSNAEALEFDKIVKIDTVYYGIKRYRGELVKMLIPLEDTTNKYKNISVFQMILGIAGLIGIIYLVDKWNLAEFLVPED
jgi:hypothetical protein